MTHIKDKNAANSDSMPLSEETLSLLHEQTLQLRARVKADAYGFRPFRQATVELQSHLITDNNPNMGPPLLFRSNYDDAGRKWLHQSKVGQHAWCVVMHDMYTSLGLFLHQGTHAELNTYIITSSAEAEELVEKARDMDLLYDTAMYQPMTQGIARE